MHLLYTGPSFLNHKTGSHPECSQRLQAIFSEISQRPVWRTFLRPVWEPSTVEQLTWLHASDHVQAVREISNRGGGRIEADTVVGPGSYEVARLAAGAAIDAVRRVAVAGKDASRAVCLIRPPGHHALPSGPMGFCLFNNVALAALTAVQELRMDRVLIVDWDVHHGNGTQDAFYEDPRVSFLSIHRAPFYPGTGGSEETGRGAGRGTTKNVPVAFGTSRCDYQRLFRQALHDLADQTRPELVLLSAGFDAHRLDPIGSLGLETEDYAWLTTDVIDVANSHAHGRLVSVLEGGYNVDVLPGCVEQHLQAMAAL